MLSCCNDDYNLALRKVNQKEQWPTGIQRILGKIRYRIETVFSVLTTSFNLDKLGSRSFSGRVATGSHTGSSVYFELLPRGDSYTRRNGIPTVLKLADRVLMQRREKKSAKGLTRFPELENEKEEKNGYERFDPP